MRGRAHRLIPQRQLPAVDDTTAHVEEWQPIGKAIYAEIAPVGGKETEVGGGMREERRHKVRFRYGTELTGLAAADRFYWPERHANLYLQTPVDIDASGRWMEVEAIQSDG